MKIYQIRYNLLDEFQSNHLKDVVEADSVEFDPSSNAYFFKSKEGNSPEWNVVHVAAARYVTSISLIKTKAKKASGK